MHQGQRFSRHWSVRLPDQRLPGQSVRPLTPDRKARQAPGYCLSPAPHNLLPPRGAGVPRRRHNPSIHFPVTHRGHGAHESLPPPQPAPHDQSAGARATDSRSSNRDCQQQQKTCQSSGQFHIVIHLFIINNSGCHSHFQYNRSVFHDKLRKSLKSCWY